MQPSELSKVKKTARNQLLLKEIHQKRPKVIDFFQE